jgi:hypothetical protein
MINSLQICTDECAEVPIDTLNVLNDLSVLVITYAAKWHGDQFHPSPLSSKKVNWFEGTGTVVGLKRNNVFILSSIHCIPDCKYSFFIKGAITNHLQQKVTICCNRFEESDNGIDVAIFSCDARKFDSEYLRRIDTLRWYEPEVFPISVNIWLVHFPTVPLGDTDAPEATTYRLHNEVYPSITKGVTISVDPIVGTFDSSIIATGGSSGGLVKNSQGLILGIHDSQHDNTPDHTVVSTHRLSIAVKSSLRHIRQLQGFFEGL